MKQPADVMLAMRAILDEQLITADGRKIGRVADVETERRPDGSLVLTHLVMGPQALAGRVSEHLQPLAHSVLHERFEHRIPIADVKNFDPTIGLRGKASDYSLGRADAWIVRYLLRWLPGSGYSWRSR